MRELPLDTARLTLAYIAAEPAMAYDEDAQAVSSAGLPIWDVTVRATTNGDAVGETLRVRVASAGMPRYPDRAKVTLAGLVARAWEHDGAWGLAYSASAIAAVNGKAPATKTTAAVEDAPPAPKRPRGRPKGSKNRTRTVPAAVDQALADNKIGPEDVETFTRLHDAEPEAIT